MSSNEPVIFKGNHYLFYGIFIGIIIGSIVFSYMGTIPFFIPFITAPLFGYLLYMMSAMKLVIEDGGLYYEGLSPVGGVDIADVHMIKPTENKTETIERDSDGFAYRDTSGKQKRNVDTTKVIACYDENGKVLFDFPENMMPEKNKSRFKQELLRINPDIEINI